MFVPPLFRKHLRSLPEYLTTKCLKPYKCLGIIVKIAKCVDFLHEGGISHSNLCLENIYVNETVRVNIYQLFCLPLYNG